MTVEQLEGRKNEKQIRSEKSHILPIPGAQDKLSAFYQNFKSLFNSHPPDSQVTLP